MEKLKERHIPIDHADSLKCVLYPRNKMGIKNTTFPQNATVSGYCSLAFPFQHHFGTQKGPMVIFQKERMSDFLKEPTKAIPESLAHGICLDPTQKLAGNCLERWFGQAGRKIARHDQKDRPGR